MRVHIVNPSDLSFGVAVITPRWMFVLAGAMPNTWGDPILTDETLEPFDPRAAERPKFCSLHNRPAPEAVTSARADVRPSWRVMLGSPGENCGHRSESATAVPIRIRRIVAGDLLRTAVPGGSTGGADGRKRAPG